MILLDESLDLLEDKRLLGQVFQHYLTNVRPKLQKWEDYYKGKQSILSKQYSDPTQNVNKIVTNFCLNITNCYDGYIASPGCIKYEGEDLEQLQSVLDYNDCNAQDQQMLENALIYGVSNSILYVDFDKQIRFDNVDPLMSFAIHGTSIEHPLRYFVRWYQVTNYESESKYICELYDDVNRYTFEMLGEGNITNLIAVDRHFFNQCPAIAMYMPEGETSIFDCIITLQDAYNECQSNTSDSLGYWNDCYLLMKNTTIPGDTATEKAEFAKQMRKNRIFEVYGDNAEVSFLTKGSSNLDPEQMLSRIEKSIYRISSTPDMSDETFGTQSGVALKYKLCGIELRASKICSQLKKALQRRLELICGYISITDGIDTWRDVNIVFTRNTPEDLSELAQIINTLNGIVSKRTLLTQIPFVKDVDTELENIENEDEYESTFEQSWQQQFVDVKDGTD